MQDRTTNEQRIQGAGDLQLFVRSWRPNRNASAVVVIVPGFNSHSGYYAWAADQLVSAGLAVHALDLRGRGKSDGERFYVQTFDDYEADVISAISMAQSQDAGLPIFLLGHSAGGVVSCLYALDHQDQLAGLICESFAFELPAPDFALAVFKGLGHLAPHAHVLRLKNADFSRDPKIVEAMDADPLIAHETQPTQTLAAMVRADERLKKEFSRITLPVLILHGTADKAAKAIGSEHFYAMAGSADKTLKLYPGGFHDLLNDIDRETVMGDIKGWVRARIPAALDRTA